jgi:hypothetical protein
MPVTAGRLGYMLCPLTLPKLALLWLLIGEWPALVYDETDDGVRAGVSSAEAEEVTVCMLEPLLRPGTLPMPPLLRWFWKLGGLLLERYWPPWPMPNSPVNWEWSPGC